jgi:hypothetical protein
MQEYNDPNYCMKIFLHRNLSGEKTRGLQGGLFLLSVTSTTV